MGLFYSQSNRERIRTLEVTNLVAIVTIGLTVGIISVYLGIGGGTTEYCTFGLFLLDESQRRSCYSILMIFFAQIIKMGTVIRDFEKIQQCQSLDFSDCDFAVLGGWIGTKIQSKLTHEAVENSI